MNMAWRIDSILEPCSCGQANETFYSLVAGELLSKENALTCSSANFSLNLEKRIQGASIK